MTIAGDPKHPGARIGITSVMHTRGLTVTYHPLFHMIVQGGGIAPDRSRWVSCRFPVPSAMACARKIIPPADV